MSIETKLLPNYYRNVLDFECDFSFYKFNSSFHRDSDNIKYAGQETVNPSRSDHIDTAILSNICIHTTDAHIYICICIVLDYKCCFATCF